MKSLLTATALVLLPFATHAAILFEKSSGISRAPSFWYGPQLGSDTEILGFDEVQNILVPDGKIQVQILNRWDDIENLTTLHVGSAPISSHMVYFQKKTLGTKERLALTAEIEFDQPILGFLADNRLFHTTNALYAPNATGKKTDVPEKARWSLEEEASWTPLDRVTLLTPTRIRIEFTNQNATDPLRVITSSEITQEKALAPTSNP